MDGYKSPFREGGLTEFHGGLPKSPMRDRFLDGLVKTPVDSRDASWSPRGRDGSYEFDRDGNNSPARSSNVSRSPVRGRGRTPLSVRTAGVSRSPMREGSSFGDLDGVGRSTGGSVNGDVPNSPLRDTGENYSGGRRSTWRDRAVDRPDQIREGGKPLLSDEQGIDRSKGGMYGDGRFKSSYVGGNARPHVVDGPSNYHLDPIHRYADSRPSFETARGPASVQELQRQREELFRKYNELNDQLSGLDGIKVSSPGLYGGGYSENEYSGPGRDPMQHFPPDRNMERPSPFNRGSGPAHDKEVVYNVNRPMYDDRQIERGPRSDQRLPKHTVPKFVPDQDPRDSYVNDWQGRDHDSSPAHSGHAKMAHNGAQGQSSHPVHHNRRLEVSNVNKRLCRPISGGAPFVICNKCFELLILPGNFIAKHKSQQLKCGGCSTVVSFDLHLKSSDPLSPQKKPESDHVTPRPSEVSSESRPKHHHGSLTATSTNIGSYDFDAEGYTIHSTGSEASNSTKGHKFDPSLADSNLGFAPSPSRFSVDERVSDAASVLSSQPNSSEMPMMFRPPPGSPVHGHIENSTHHHLSKADGTQVSDKDTSIDVPIDITDATEIPYDGGPNTGETQYSGDISRESPASGNNEVVESRINDLVLDLESISDHGSLNIAEVYVNGQAISHRSVKKAEKFAGPIQPGEYWYDPKAGFWGVMGHQCLGIIPPFIQEFCLPMPENCSRGDSAVYVNGRELPKKDLDLLAGRKLPTKRDKRYVVDISGKVLDEQTRDFVVNLGRLAPTVERKKCGFGMQVPKQLDD